MNEAERSEARGSVRCLAAGCILSLSLLVFIALAILGAHNGVRLSWWVLLGGGIFLAIVVLGAVIVVGRAIETVGTDITTSSKELRSDERKDAD
jgi:hypothetical protein